MYILNTRMLKLVGGISIFAEKFTDLTRIKDFKFRGTKRKLYYKENKVVEICTYPYVYSMLETQKQLEEKSRFQNFKCQEQHIYEEIYVKKTHL